MLAYKFRSVANIKYVFDILLNERLFCADWRSLNDPMEGYFQYEADKEGRGSRYAEIISANKLRYKVCSLSKVYESPLMWAHYADGFSGLVVEVDITVEEEDTTRDYDPILVAPVIYREDFTFVKMGRRAEPISAARKILLTKQANWAYEEEIRILSEDTYFEIKGSIKRVIVGPRMDQALFDALKLICTRRHVPFWKLDLVHGKFAPRLVGRGHAG